VSAADALSAVAGLVVVADLSVPHDSFYRPSVRHKARDGFCPIGPQVVPVDAVADVDDLAVTVCGRRPAGTGTSTGDRVRGGAVLLADVSEFMTLRPATCCCWACRPARRWAARATPWPSTIDGLGTLSFTLVAEVHA
jgi:5-oxopent-3-ene-1,2,5-tricarboxylate decarboxylase/2-hydroxyhepta-2,4-diene-1,7-dioate isomerase